MQDWSLGWEDALEKEMATHFSILAREIPWTEEPGRLQFIGSQRVWHVWATERIHTRMHKYLNSGIWNWERKIKKDGLSCCDWILWHVNSDLGLLCCGEQTEKEKEANTQGRANTKDREACLDFTRSCSPGFQFFRRPPTTHTLPFLALLFFFLWIFVWCGPFLKLLLNLLQYCFSFVFWLFGHEACGILASPSNWKVKS